MQASAPLSAAPSPAPALTIHFQGASLAPSQFEQRWRRSAAALQAAGVGEGDVVALMMRNSPEAVELMVAVRYLGAQWCPVNWHFKTDEVQYIVQDSGAKLFIADAALLAGLTGLDAGATRVFCIRGALPGVPAWEPLRDASEPIGRLSARPRGAMLYTSGTTGRPKGILRHAMTPSQVEAGVQVRRAAYGIAPGLRGLLTAPWYHSAPNSFALGIALEGGELFIEERFDAERTLQLIAAQRLTHAYLVPTMYVRMLALPPEVRSRYDLSSMRFVSSTGSPCPPDVKRAMIEWWGPVIHECYGASELGYMTLLTSEQALRKPGSAGLPLPGVSLRILDEQNRELPRNVPGLIYIHQPATPDFSYVGNHEARERMEVAGLKTMGDIGYIDDDGFLYIVDRKSDMVISGGVNIYPVEIEIELQRMPGVADCAVFGIPDPEFGEALAAAVQLAEGAACGADEVRAWLRERLAGYKVPRVVEFHAQLPREDTGKIFKRKLREPYWAGQARRV